MNIMHRMMEIVIVAKIIFVKQVEMIPYNGMKIVT